MNYDLEERIAAAEDLAPIAQGGFGQVVTLTHVTPGSYDTATATETGATTTTQTGSGVEIAYTAREIDGNTIRVGDKKLLLSPLNSAGAALLAPELGDTAALASGTWTILAIEPLSPAGTVIMWTLHLRGI